MSKYCGKNLFRFVKISTKTNGIYIMCALHERLSSNVSLDKMLFCKKKSPTKNRILKKTAKKASVSECVIITQFFYATLKTLDRNGNMECIIVLLAVFYGSLCTMNLWRFDSIGSDP